MEFIYFLVCFGASLIGAVSGIGGGVIIKPVLDSLGTLDISAIRFLSGCTVLAMAVCTMIRARGGDARVNPRVSVPLAVGSCLGGIVGKEAFQLLTEFYAGGNRAAVMQSALLLAINVGVLLYLQNRARIRSHSISSAAVCCLIGLLLGTLSSFLGIGGGPINIAVLYYFFSMRPKETALNSIFIIVFSQSSSLLGTLVGRSVPEVSLAVLLVMCTGGVMGALAGRQLSCKLSETKVERLFRVVLLLLIALNVYNLVRFTL